MQDGVVLTLSMLLREVEGVPHFVVCAHEIVLEARHLFVHVIELLCTHRTAHVDQGHRTMRHFPGTHISAYQA